MFRERGRRTWEESISRNERARRPALLDKKQKGVPLSNGTPFEVFVYSPA
jgi:hypothetical protein